MLFSDPWRKIDPELVFKNYLSSVIGRWKLAKLSSIFQIYKIFDSEFFQKPLGTYKGIEISIDGQKESFICFINSLITKLTKNKIFNDAEFVARISLELKNLNNPAHFHLVPILIATSKYKEALKEAKLALEDLKRMEEQVSAIPEDIKSEFSINNPAEYKETRKFLLSTIQDLENRNLDE